MIELRNVYKIYSLESGEVCALDGINTKFPETGIVFILGKSGSGKSTMLNVLGGLDNITSGEILIDGKSFSDYKEKDYDSYRNRYIGFIFQEYNLIDSFNVGKNISIALELQDKRGQRALVEESLRRVGLEGYYNRKISELSGGQRQRVAIARALVKNPRIIFADEPTGNLDSTTAEDIFNLLRELSRDRLIVIVSHDIENTQKYADRIIELKDGKIINDINNLNCRSNNISFDGKEKEERRSFESKNVKMPIAGKSNGNMSLVNMVSYAISNLRQKKIRVIASIVLFILSLALFNFAYGANRYDIYDTTINTFEKMGYEYLNLKCRYNYEKISYIDDTFKEDGIPIYQDRSYFIYIENEIQHEECYYDYRITSSMPINDNIMATMNMALLYGRLPSTSMEVCISKYTAESLLALQEKYFAKIGIEKIDDFVGRKLDGDNLFTIVGIVDTNLPEKYDVLKDIKGSDFLHNPLFNSFKMELGKVHNSVLRPESYYEDFYTPYGEEYFYEKVIGSGFVTTERLKAYPMNAIKLLDVKYEVVQNAEEGIIVPDYIARYFISEQGYYEELEDNSINSTIKVLASHNIISNMAYGLKDDQEYSCVVNDRITGVYDDSVYHSLAFISESALMHLQDNIGCINSINIDMNNKAALHRAIELSNLVVGQDSNMGFANDVADDVDETKNYALMCKNIAGAGAIIFAIIVVVLMLNYFFSTIKDKSREIGILRALGVKSSNVLLIFLIEALIISIIAFIVSLPISIGVADWTESTVMKSLGEAYDVDVPFIDVGIISSMITFALCISVVLVGSIVPIIRITKMKPMEIVRK